MPTANDPQRRTGAVPGEQRGKRDGQDREDRGAGDRPDTIVEHEPRTGSDRHAPDSADDTHTGSKAP